MYLKDGLRLDLNNLVCKRLIFPRARTGPLVFGWGYTHTDGTIATGLITADRSGEPDASLRIQLGNTLAASSYKS